MTENEKLLGILNNFLAVSGAPAAAGIVVSADSVIAAAAVGVRKLGEETAVTLKDQFHIGSCGKGTTGTLCAIAVAKGLLSWETTPLEIFPDLKGKIKPAYETITLDMLNRHMAGIPPYTDDSHFEDPHDLSGTAVEQRAVFTRWLLTERDPVVAPRTEFSYSNAGVSIAGTMLEAAAGKAWEDLLQEWLFLPLGIKGGHGWPARRDPAQPWGHMHEDGRFVPHPPDDEYQLEAIIAPAGDIRTTLPGQGRYLQMHLKGLQGRETGILPADLIRYLHNDGQPGLAVGWGVRPRDNIGLCSEHIGGAGTFLFLESVVHARDRAVAVTTNAGGESTERSLASAFKQMLQTFVGWQPPEES